MPIQVLRTFSVTARSAFVSLHNGSALQPSPHLPRLAAQISLPTRRDSRGASPWRASFRSFSPPQNCALFLPPAAVAALPLWKRLGRCFVVTPPDAPLPVGIPSVSLCRRARSARPAVTACSGRYLPAALLGALLSPPQTRSLFPPRQRSRICPLWGTRGSRPSAGARPSTHGILRLSPQNDRKGEPS